MNQQPHFLVSTQRNENIYSHKSPYADIYSSFICSQPDLETTQMPFNKWISKLWSICAMKYYSVMKRERLLLHQQCGLKDYTVWLYLCDILRKTKLQVQKADQLLLGAERKNDYQGVPSEILGERMKPFFTLTIVVMFTWFHVSVQTEL